MEQLLTLYGREVVIRKPTLPFYLRLVKLAKKLVQQGYLSARDLSGSQEIGSLDALLAIMDVLEEGHINELAAILMQPDDMREAVEFINAHGGVDPVWFMQALSMIVEVAELDLVLFYFRKVQDAIRGWSSRVAEQAETGAEPTGA